MFSSDLMQANHKSEFLNCQKYVLTTRIVTFFYIGALIGDLL